MINTAAPPGHVIAYEATFCSASLLAMDLQASVYCKGADTDV